MVLMGFALVVSEDEVADKNKWTIDLTSYEFIPLVYNRLLLMN